MGKPPSDIDETVNRINPTGEMIPMFFIEDAETGKRHTFRGTLLAEETHKNGMTRLYLVDDGSFFFAHNVTSFRAMMEYAGEPLELANYTARLEDVATWVRRNCDDWGVPHFVAETLVRAIPAAKELRRGEAGGKGRLT